MYHTFIIHSSVDGHIGCLQILAILKTAAVNMEEKVSLWYDRVLSVYASGTAGFCGRKVIINLIQLQTLQAITTNFLPNMPTGTIVAHVLQG